MGRIRTIKPEFPQSESVGRLSREARLTFILLWTFVDDSGKARAASRMLASGLFPYDDDAPSLIDGWLAELEREGCIFRYTVNGDSYLRIENWQKHQKVDRPSPSRIPDPREDSAHPREPSRILATDLGPRTVDQVPRTVDQEVVLPRARDLETELREAAGWQNEPAPNLAVTGAVAALINAGADLDLDVLPTVRAIAPQARSRTTWKYFLGAIAQARDDRIAASQIISPPSNQRPRHARRQTQDEQLADIVNHLGSRPIRSGAGSG